MDEFFYEYIFSMFLKFILFSLPFIYGISIIGFLFPKIKLGIIPRTYKGLIGILFAPLLHSNFKHLLSNTFPLLVLLFLLQYFYATKAIMVISFVVVGGGFLVWLFARNANHIGASGLIYGLAAFMITQGFLCKEMIPLLVAIFIVLIYGGLLKGMFPSTKKTSWEGHLFYAISGILSAYLLK